MILPGLIQAQSSQVNRTASLRNYGRSSWFGTEARAEIYPHTPLSLMAYKGLP